MVLLVLLEKEQMGWKVNLVLLVRMEKEQMD